MLIYMIIIKIIITITIIEPWTHWWEASTLTAAPSLLPISKL